MFMKKSMESEDSLWKCGKQNVVQHKWAERDIIFWRDQTLLSALMATDEGGKAGVNVCKRVQFVSRVILPIMSPKNSTMLVMVFSGRFYVQSCVLNQTITIIIPLSEDSLTSLNFPLCFHICHQHLSSSRVLPMLFSSGVHAIVMRCSE